MNLQEYDWWGICEKLETKRWYFAKTMAGIPHYYTLRAEWGDEQDFENVVHIIRKRGVVEQWRHYNHSYAYLSGFKYWSMNGKLDETLLINRARYTHSTPYDDIANNYDSLFYKKKYLEENRSLFRLLNIKGKVLDIGCGTGLLPEWVSLNPSNYVGIDPSKGMLDKFAWKHPEFAASLKVCKFENFWTSGFDTIVALYGVGSYITEPSRVLDMLNEGGKAYLMYYSPEYEPVTSKIEGINDCKMVSYPQREASDQITFSNYVIDIWEK